MPGLVDSHCHCHYSPDAEGSVDDYCRAAMERNLAELCFTTHLELGPVPEGMDDPMECLRIGEVLVPASVDRLAAYVDDVRRAHEKFYPLGLSVKLGVEFGWFRGCEEAVVEVRNRFGIDHMLGGIHDLDGVMLERRFAEMGPEKAAEMYFQEVIRLARTGLFDAVAHLDYYRRHSAGIPAETINAVHRPFAGELFAALREGEAALEVNTSALRHGLAEYYPRMEIVNAARRAGVEVAFLGSDAHRPEEVGFDFEAAVAVVPPAATACDDEAG
jgi:histidinol-phosphatase (PHP family)